MPHDLCQGINMECAEETEGMGPIINPAISGGETHDS